MYTKRVLCKSLSIIIAVYMVIGFVGKGLQIRAVAAFFDWGESCDIAIDTTGPFVFNGTRHYPTIVVLDEFDGSLLTWGKHYTVTYNNNISAGTTASVTVEGLSGTDSNNGDKPFDYTNCSETVNFTIEKVTLTANEFTFFPEAIADGIPKPVFVSVTIMGAGAGIIVKYQGTGSTVFALSSTPLSDVGTYKILVDVPGDYNTYSSSGIELSDIYTIKSPVTTFALTVKDGIDETNTGPYTADSIVNIKANTASPNQNFIRWESDAGGTFANSTSSTTTFTMPANDVTVTAIYSDSANGTTYNVTTKPTVPYTGTGNAKFTIDADFSKFEKLTLNGVEIASSNYTAQSGSTIITLLDSYLKTLSNGTHTFRAVFDDGYANLTLVIANSTSSAPGQQSGSGSGGVGNGNSGSVAGSGFGGTNGNHSTSVNEDRNPNTGTASDVIGVWWSIKHFRRQQ